MFKFLFDVEQNKVIYIFKSLALVLVCGYSMSFLMSLLFPNATYPDIPTGFPLNLITVIVGPLIETLLMLFVFKIISYFTNSLLYSCFISALIWAILHSLSTPIHGVVIFLSFFIFSISFKVWEKVSKDLAFAITAAIHMLNNLVAINV